MTDEEPKAINRPKAKVMASQPPPRIVHFVNTRRDEEEDEEPVLRRPKRSPMASLIIYIFTGAMTGCLLVIGAFLVLNLTRHFGSQRGPSSDLYLLIFASLLPGIPAFILGAFIGAFVWAVSRPKR